MLKDTSTYSLRPAAIHTDTQLPGANPLIVSYNASAVKNYNAMSSLVRFENKYFLSTLKKRPSLGTTTLALYL
jgi:hypothetical protein